jgi:hypothetical protein
MLILMVFLFTFVALVVFLVFLVRFFFSLLLFFLGDVIML